MSWADAVKKKRAQNNQFVQKQTVKEAVRSVSEEEERSRNLIIYGVKETKEGEWEDIFNVDIHNSKRNFIMFTFFIYEPILRSLFYIVCI